MNNIFIGTDIEEIKRFQGKIPEKHADFLNRIFTENELDYCFKSKFPEKHLCARFCAKESVVKALRSSGIKDVYYSDIEILNDKDGCPFVTVKKYPEISFKISLSHCKTYATATVIAKLN